MLYATITWFNLVRQFISHLMLLLLSWPRLRVARVIPTLVGRMIRFLTYLTTNDIRLHGTGFPKTVVVGMIFKWEMTGFTKVARLAIW